MKRLSRTWHRLKSPFLIRRVRGHSMTPTLKPDQIVFASSWLKPKNKSIVIAESKNIEIVKRYDTELNLLKGDNLNHTSVFKVSDAPIRAVVFGKFNV